MNAAYRSLNAGPVYRVWIDETGDRGSTPASSPFFIVAAVVIRADRMSTVRIEKQLINRDLHRNVNTELHWSANLKHHDKRMRACEGVAKPNLRIVYACIEKASLTPGLRHQNRLYNWPLRLVLERVSWLIDH